MSDLPKVSNRVFKKLFFKNFVLKSELRSEPRSPDFLFFEQYQYTHLLGTKPEHRTEDTHLA